MTRTGSDSLALASRPRLRFGRLAKASSGTRIGGNCLPGKKPGLRFVLAGVILLAQSDRAAASEAIYNPPTGFWIAPNNFGHDYYGSTSPSANWHIAQWDIPQGLPPFGDRGITFNRWARVAWLGGGSYELSQDGSTAPDGSALPCEKVFPTGRRLPDEFDLLAESNNSNARGFPLAVGSVDFTLASVSRLETSITLQINQAYAADDACSISQTSFVDVVVLSDRALKQTLFFTVRLGFFRFSGAPASLRPAWFFKGNNIQFGGARTWGFDDNTDSFNQPLASIGTAQHYQFDLLPRILSVISDGAQYGLDQDLTHWRFSGTYHGQNIWGHVKNDAVWSDYSLSAN